MAGLLLSTSARAQSLADSVAWERLGGVLEIEAFGFTATPEAPLIWAVGQGAWMIQDVTGPWIEINIAAPSRGQQVLFYGPDSAKPDTVFAGSPLNRSVDGGKTFVDVETPADLGGSPRIGGPGYDRIPTGAPHAHRFVAFDDHSFLLSDDGGDTWVAADSSPFLIAFSVKALRSGRILAAGFYGAVLSDDGGHTWRPIPALYDTTAIRFDLHNITVLPGLVTGRPGDSTEGRVVLTGTTTRGDGGWYQWWSDDEGETWSRSLQPGDAGCGEGVDFVPLVAETGRSGDVMAVTCEGLVLQSEDGAETWAEVGRVPGISSEANTLVATAALGPDGRLYVGTAYRGPAAIHSYRTKWRASDGFAVPSEDGPEDAAVELQASPNPSRQLVTVELAGAPGTVRQLVAVDARGREVARGEVAAGSSWRLDVSGWAPGIYRVRAEGASAEAAVAFTVVR